MEDNGHFLLRCGRCFAGKNCLSTLKAIYGLYERYRYARTTIAALHSEITVVGASMQYINVIFEQHPDLARTRFRDNPEPEQTFAAALAGCNLVLSCLDEEVEKIVAGLGPEGSKGRKGKAQLLWKEDTMKSLLQTLRGTTPGHLLDYPCANTT